MTNLPVLWERYQRGIRRHFLQLTIIVLAVFLIVQPVAVAFAAEEGAAPAPTTSPVDGGTTPVVLPEPTTPTPVDDTPVGGPVAPSPIAEPVIPTPTDPTDDGPATSPDPAPTDPTADGTDDTTKDNTDAQTNTLSPGQQDTNVIPKAFNAAKPKTDLATGALGYSFSFMTPPARGGLDPNLALSYNSQNSDDMSYVGYGWSFNVPYIERQNRNGIDKLYTDNNFTSTLSGELVNTSGASYKARFEGGDNLSYSFSNNVWTVLDKHGRTYVFGQTAASRQDDSANSTKVFRWMLTSITDLNGNYISYGYLKDAGQIYPSGISYGNNHNASSDAVINFNYDPIVGVQAFRSYQPGFLVQTGYKLSSVISSPNGSPGNHEYYFEYVNGQNGRRQMLDNIREIHKRYGTNDVMPPRTRFEYSNSLPTWTDATSSLQVPSDGSRLVENNYNDPLTLGSTAQFVDLNGDGYQDLFTYPSNGSAHVYFSNGQNGWVEQTGWTFPQFTNCANQQKPITPREPTSGKATGLQVVDINNDNKADLVWLNPWVYCQTTGLYTQYPTAIYLNTGTGWTQDTGWTAPADAGFFVRYAYGFSDLRPGGLRLADINGDHLPDLVESSTQINSFNNINSVSRIWLHNGHGWDLSTSYTMPVGKGCTYNAQYDQGPIPFNNYERGETGNQLTDMNSDGLADLVVYETPCSSGNGSTGSGTTWKRGVWWNTGSTWVWSGNDLISGQDSSRYQMTDLNADGVVDMYDSIYSGTGSSQNWYRGDGLGLLSGNPITYPIPTEATCGGSVTSLPVSLRNQFSSGSWNGISGHTGSTGLQVTDINGDGLPDLFKYNQEVPCLQLDANGTTFNPPYASRLWLASGTKPDLLTKITYNTGGNTVITYQGTGKERVNGAIANPNLPYTLQVVKTVTDNDGLGQAATTTYNYQGAKTFARTPGERKFAGFSAVQAVDGVGTTSTSYYHQGDGSGTTASESVDDEALIGRAYAATVTNAGGNLYQQTYTKYGVVALANGRLFTPVTQTLTQSYDGNSSHRDIATSITYDSAFNPLVSTNYGEVAGTSTGDFTDTGSDSQVTTLSYATFSGGAQAGQTSDFIAQSTTTNNQGSVVSTQRYRYDGLAQGSVLTGNATKTEQQINSSTWAAVNRTYNSFGLPLTETDANNNTTTYTYDSSARYPATVTNAKNQVTSYTYEYLFGQPLTVVDANNQTHTYRYNGIGVVELESGPTMLVTRSLAFNTVGTTGYETTSIVNQYPNSASFTTTYTSDGLGRTISTQQSHVTNGQADTVCTDTFYNNIGHIGSTSAPYICSLSSLRASPTNLRTSYTYDALGRVTTATDTLGTQTENFDDWAVTQTDRRGKQKVLRYDAFGRLIAVDEKNAGSTYTTGYTYNTNGNLTNITDALGNVRAFIYDFLGRRTRAEDLHAPADTTYGVYLYAYDANGNQTSVTKPDGTIITKTYDALNRPLTEDASNVAGVQVGYTYDTCTQGIGRLCSSETFGVTRTDYTYDAEGRVSTENQNTGNQAFITQTSYTDNGLPKVITYPDGSQVQYDYAADGNIHKVWRKEAADTSFTAFINNIDYGPNGQPIVTTYASGVVTTNTYDASQLYRLTRKLTVGPASLGSKHLQDITYTYDANGNITQLVDNSDTNSKRTIVYAYDDLNRLLSVTTTGATGAPGLNGVESYTYDAIGNILTKTGQGAYTYGGTAAGSYANPHAVTGIGTNTYIYDASGNMITAITAGQTSLPWYSSGGTWTNRKQVTIDHTKVVGAENLTDFAVLVSVTDPELKSTANGGAVAKTNGDDILFTAADGTTKLAHEIDSYDPVTGTLNAWVKVPQLSPATDTQLVLYYGNAASSNQQNKTAVWSNNYAGVWHMPADTTSGVPDSSPNNYSSLNNRFGSAAGKVASASNNTTSDTNGSPIRDTTQINNLTSGFTLSGWIKPYSSTNPGYIMAADRTATNNGFGLKWQKGALILEAFGASASTSGDCAALAGSWKKFDVVVGATDIKFYCGGVLKTTSPVLLPFSANPEDQFRLGGTTAAGSPTPSNAFYGQLDELRVQTGAASEAWLQTEHNNQSSPSTFVTLGPVVGTPTTITTNYGWNWQNRMITANTATGAVSFGYDSNGQRVQETRGSVRTWSPTTNYRISGTTAPDITQTTKDIFLGSSIVGTIKGQGGAAIVSGVHADHLGSPSVLTSPTGAQSQLQAYAAYGTQVLQEGSNLTDRDFTGHRFDADTNLTFANARYYNQDIGRFTSEDPVFWSLGLNLADPQGINSYTYARNNPTLLVDRNGQWPTISELGSFVTGLGNAVLSNTFLGAGRKDLPDPYYSAGQKLGDAVSLVQSGLELVAGAETVAGGAASSVVLGPTGIGVVAGSGAVATGLAIGAHGIGVAGVSYRNLSDSQSSNKIDNMWTSKDSYKSSTKSAYSHWKKHKDEFPELNNAKEYVTKARSYIDDTPSGTLTRDLSNGRKAYYNPNDNTIVLSKDGAPASMYRPSPSKHGLGSNLDYFNSLK